MSWNRSASSAPRKRGAIDALRNVGAATALRRSAAIGATLAVACSTGIAAAPVTSAAPCAPGVMDAAVQGNNFLQSMQKRFQEGLHTVLPQIGGPLPGITNVAGPTQFIGWVTGPNSPQANVGISGTDLGIMWDNGADGPDKQILMAFGDTFGQCGAAHDEWRSNVLFRSADSVLSDGITVAPPDFGNLLAGVPVSKTRPEFAKQIIRRIGLTDEEVSVLPTAGIAIGGKQYANFMSIQNWGDAGKWSTNYSAVAESSDNGEHWTADRKTIRATADDAVRGVEYRDGDEDFQMASYLKRDGFVYSYGTPSGRFGQARVARVKESEFTQLDKYEYFDGSEWTVGEPSAAVPIMDGDVSELSVAWNDFLGKYIAMHTTNGPRAAVVMRTADSPEGPWSPARDIVTNIQAPTIYAPFIHPWSSGNELYWVASTWTDYNVALMRTTL